MSKSIINTNCFENSLIHLIMFATNCSLYLADKHLETT